MRIKKQLRAFVVVYVKSLIKDGIEEIKTQRISSVGGTEKENSHRVCSACV